MPFQLSVRHHRCITLCVATIIGIIAVSAIAVRAEALQESEAKVRDLTAAINKEPNNPEPYAVRGLFYLKADEDEKSLADLNKALLLNPNHCGALVCRGDLYTKIGEFAKAQKDYMRCGDITRDDALKGLSYQQAGRAQARTGNFSDAITLLNKAYPYAEARRKTQILVNRAEVHLALKQYAAVIADVDAIPPNSKVQWDKAHEYKATALKSLGKYEQAIPEYTEAIKLSETSTSSFTGAVFNTKTSTYFKERAICFEKIGKKDAAAHDRRKAQSVQEDSLMFAPFR